MHVETNGYTKQPGALLGGPYNPQRGKNREEFASKKGLEREEPANAALAPRRRKEKKVNLKKLG